MMVINCNGIRNRYRRILLAELLYRLHIGVCIITETHLRKEEVKQLKFLHYTVVSDYSRVTTAE